MVDTQDVEAKKEKAAYLLGTTSDSVDEIAIYAGTTKMSIMDWLGDPEFTLRVTHFQNAHLAEMKRLPYARKADRIKAYSDDLQRLDTVIAARQRSFTAIGETESNTTTGGVSGLVIHKIKAVGTGDMQTIVDEYEIDNALLQMRLAVNKQMAQELGDYEPGANNSGGGTVLIQFTSDTPGPEDELADG